MCKGRKILVCSSGSHWSWQFPGSAPEATGDMGWAGHRVTMARVEARSVLLIWGEGRLSARWSCWVIPWLGSGAGMAMAVTAAQLPGSEGTLWGLGWELDFTPGQLLGSVLCHGLGPLFLPQPWPELPRAVWPGSGPQRKSQLARVLIDFKAHLGWAIPSGSRGEKEANSLGIPGPPNGTSARSNLHKAVSRLGAVPAGPTGSRGSPPSPPSLSFSLPFGGLIISTPAAPEAKHYLCPQLAPSALHGSQPRGPLCMASHPTHLNPVLTCHFATSPALGHHLGLWPKSPSPTFPVCPL